MTESAGKLHVLITGAHGLIGNLVYARLAEQPDAYDAYGMARRLQPSARAAPERFHEIPAEKLRLADLSDFAAVRRAVEGMDVVVHLAANPDGRADFQSILESNIIGAYHVFEACRLEGVKRVVYASTNQVVFGYRVEQPYEMLFQGRFDQLKPGEAPPIRHDQPTRPMNFYACSKVYGEALAHMYAFSHGLSCICLRIGWVLADDSMRSRILYCSQRDIVQLVERCIHLPESVRFDVFFGQSDNRFNLVDIQHAREVLGYAPQDSAEEHLT